MTVWLDAHLSPRVARWITKRFGIQASSLREIGLRDAEDLAIWAAAEKADAVILTKDADFEELARRFGPPPHVIWLTCGNTSEARLQEILTDQLLTAMELIRSGEPLVEIH